MRLAPCQVTGAEVEHMSSAKLSAHESVRGRPLLHDLAVAVWIAKDDEPNATNDLDCIDLERLNFYM